MLEITGTQAVKGRMCAAEPEMSVSSVRSDSTVSKVKETADPERPAIATHASDSQGKINRAEWTFLSHLIQQHTA